MTMTVAFEGPLLLEPAPPLPAPPSGLTKISCRECSLPWRGIQRSFMTLSRCALVMLVLSCSHSSTSLALSSAMGTSASLAIACTMLTDVTTPSVARSKPSSCATTWTCSTESLCQPPCTVSRVCQHE
jgi:hypothetical protein